MIGDPNLGLDFTRVLHGSQEYFYERPLREGETLNVRARIESIRHKGGTGLGLSIVQAIVDAHGGRVAIRTAPGHGTAVRVELPLPT